MADIVKTTKKTEQLAFNGSNMRRGDSGAYVRAAKERLFELGMYSPKVLKITSDTLGDDSVAAIKRFQTKVGIQVDGVIGPVTWAALFGTSLPVVNELSDEATDALQKALDQMLALCEEQVRNHSCYVWAASGELGAKVTESWIRKKEQRYNEGERADDAVAAWEEQLAAGNDLFRVFDCSGFVSWVLTRVGVISGHRNCDSLWSLSDKLDAPENGALLFKVNKENKEDETHVGLYFNGYQYHCKGRSDGVVKEKYNPKYWAKCARFKALARL